MAETTSSEKAEPPSDKATKPSAAKEAAPAKKQFLQKKQLLN